MHQIANRRMHCKNRKMSIFALRQYFLTYHDFVFSFDDFSRFKV